MRSFVVAALLGALALAPSVASVVPSANLVVNGDFETFAADTPVGWLVNQGEARSTTDSASGARAVELTQTVGAAIIEQYLVARPVGAPVGGVLPVSYELSVSAKAAGALGERAIMAPCLSTPELLVCDIVELAEQFQTFTFEVPAPTVLPGVATLSLTLISIHAEPGAVRFVVDDVQLIASKS